MCSLAFLTRSAALSAIFCLLFRCCDVIVDCSVDDLSRRQTLTLLGGQAEQRPENVVILFAKQRCGVFDRRGRARQAPGRSQRRDWPSLVVGDMRVETALPEMILADQ